MKARSSNMSKSVYMLLVAVVIINVIVTYVMIKYFV